MIDQGEEYIDRTVPQFTHKLGVVLADVLTHFQVMFFKGFTFLPDMAIHFGSFLVIDDFTRVTGQSDITDGIGFVFYNIFDDHAREGSDKRNANQTMEPPYVRIFPYVISQTLHFRKNTLVPSA